jgi:hypothetical protein
VFGSPYPASSQYQFRVKNDSCNYNSRLCLPFSLTTLSLSLPTTLSLFFLSIYSTQDGYEVVPLDCARRRTKYAVRAYLLDISARSHSLFFSRSLGLRPVTSLAIEGWFRDGMVRNGFNPNAHLQPCAYVPHVRLHARLYVIFSLSLSLTRLLKPYLLFIAPCVSSSSGSACWDGSTIRSSGAHDHLRTVRTHAGERISRISLSQATYYRHNGKAA